MKATRRSFIGILTGAVVGALGVVIGRPKPLSASELAANREVSAMTLQERQDAINKARSKVLRGSFAKVKEYGRGLAEQESKAKQGARLDCLRYSKGSWGRNPKIEDGWVDLQGCTIDGKQFRLLQDDGWSIKNGTVDFGGIPIEEAAQSFGDPDKIVRLWNANKWAP